MSVLLDSSASGAELSTDGRYRYRLRRRWAVFGEPLVFCMLNPSTADASLDDGWAASRSRWLHGWAAVCGVAVLIAALYVRADGPYANRPDVDAWDIRRDARLYAGPWPVVAHPPCARWFAKMWAHKTPVGADDGCFEAALASVRRWGGVIEHPEESIAWPTFGLPRPPMHGEGWGRSLFAPNEWACSVDQSAYGHEARKRTWLFYVGPTPPMMDRRESAGTREVPTSIVKGRQRSKGNIVELMSHRQRELTPPAFAEALIDLARGSALVAP